MILRIIRRIQNEFNMFKGQLWIKILRQLGPSFAAWYYGRRFSALCHNFDPRKKTVFTYKLPQYIRDVVELQNKTNFNYIVVDCKDLFDIRTAFFPPLYSSQVLFVGDDSPECQPYKELITEIFIKIFQKINRHHKIDFILCANFDSSQDYGMSVAGRKLGIKSFVFYYELPTIPIAKAHWQAAYGSGYYNIQLSMDKIALWSNSTEHYLINGKICNQSQMVITGAPRFDRWRDFDLGTPPKNYIVLMAYPGAEYFAACNFLETLRSLMELSKKYTNHTFFVKCKNAAQTQEILYLLNGLPDHNLQISHDFDLVELQAQAKVVIGFNSLSILEAMLSNAILVNPNWGDAALDPFMLQLDPNDQLVNDIYHMPKSRKEFKSILENALNQSKEAILEESLTMRLRRDELFARFFFRDPNISSSKLFEEMMLSS